MFVIRATNLVSTHNINLGGSQRDRFVIYTQYCLRYYTLLYLEIWLHLILCMGLA